MFKTYLLVGKLKDCSDRQEEIGSYCLMSTEFVLQNERILKMESVVVAVNVNVLYATKLYT